MCMCTFTYNMGDDNKRKWFGSLHSNALLAALPSSLSSHLRREGTERKRDLSMLWDQSMIGSGLVESDFYFSTLSNWQRVG